MLHPYEISDGQIVEHKMSFEMQLNALNNKDKRRVEVKAVKVPDVFKMCSCGKVFKLTDSIMICEPCYDKFESHSHYVAVMKRNKEWVGK